LDHLIRPGGAEGAEGLDLVVPLYWLVDEEKPPVPS
jgi:hypothetical protein